MIESSKFVTRRSSSSRWRRREMSRTKACHRPSGSVLLGQLDGHERAVFSLQRPFPHFDPAGGESSLAGVDEPRRIFAREDVEDRPPQQLVALVTEHLAGRGVHVRAAPVGIGDEHALRRLIEERTKVRFGLVEGFHRALARAGVADRDGQEQVAMIGQAVEAHLDGKLFTALLAGQQRALVDATPGQAGRERAGVGRERLPVPAGNERGERLRQEIRAGVAEHGLALRAGKDDMRAAVDEQKRHGGRVEQTPHRSSSSVSRTQHAVTLGR